MSNSYDAMSYFCNSYTFCSDSKKSFVYVILINDNMMHYFSLKGKKFESFCNLCVSSKH